MRPTDELAGGINKFATNLHSNKGVWSAGDDPTKSLFVSPETQKKWVWRSLVIFLESFAKSKNMV